MASTATIEVEGYTLLTDRVYDPATHLWVRLDADGHALIGLDPLGRETMGDVVALSLADVGTRLRRGDSFGDVEAAKFVGPLHAPLSGVVAARNEGLLASPGQLNDDPLAHWLVELRCEPVGRAEMAEMVSGADALAAWFADEVARFRAQGALAE